MKTISPGDLVVLDDYVGRTPLLVDTVYAQAGHKDNMFKEAIYRADARMLCHHALAAIVLSAAEDLWARHRLHLACKDCLRPVEAQEKIANTGIVRANPQWLEEPRLFSPPGRGGHPRGMAIDVLPVTENGEEIDMGTPFDHLATDKSLNPAARDHRDFGDPARTARVLENRQILTDTLCRAAENAGRVLVPLPQEWWDFRFPNEETALYAPIRDADLPPALKMMP